MIGQRGWTLWLPTPVYAACFGLAVYLQARFAPAWLVESRSGLQTILQAVPATVIALFVLAFTALFVVVQQTVAVFSSRAPLLLTLDRRVRRIVARTVVVAVAALLIGGKVPDDSMPADWVTASGATLLIATVLLIFNYGRFVTILIAEYSAPRSFIRRVVDPISKYVNRATPDNGQLILRLSVLSQTLRYALRRDDAETVGMTLEGLRRFHSVSIEAAVRYPAVRHWDYGGERPTEGWLGDELRRLFVEATEEALRLRTPQDELDWLVDHYGDALQREIRAQHDEESRPLLRGFLQLAANPYQVSDGVWNYLTRTGPPLAASVALADEAGMPEIAALSLAYWAAAMVDFQLRTQRTHPLFQECLAKLGDSPPWDRAIGLVQEQSWRMEWANQLSSECLDLLPTVLGTIRARQSKDPSQLRRLRREIYSRWLATVDRFGTWAFDSTEGFDQWRRNVDARMTELQYAGSEKVRLAARLYVQQMPVTEIVTKATLTQEVDDNTRREAIETAYRDAMSKPRAAVRAVMEQDIGPFDDERS